MLDYFGQSLVAILLYSFVVFIVYLATVKISSPMSFKNYLFCWLKGLVIVFVVVLLSVLLSITTWGATKLVDNYHVSTTQNLGKGEDGHEGGGLGSV